MRENRTFGARSTSPCPLRRQRFRNRTQELGSNLVVGERMHGLQDHHLEHEHMIKRRTTRPSIDHHPPTLADRRSLRVLECFDTDSLRAPHKPRGWNRS
jgi:hypothetical protein